MVLVKAVSSSAVLKRIDESLSDKNLDYAIRRLLDIAKEKSCVSFDEIISAADESKVEIMDIDDIVNELGINVVEKHDEEKDRIEEHDEWYDEKCTEKISDPVRMYLTQMAKIPLLSLDRELAIAKKIELTRKRYANKVLSCQTGLNFLIKTCCKKLVCL